MEEWQCGATEWDKAIAHQLANESCPILMRDANMCCLAHDVCYAEHFSQEACDQAFCECLNAMAEEARGTQYAMGCLDASQWFCFAVKMFGHSAHGSAKESVANDSYSKNEGASEPAQSFTKTHALTSTVASSPSETAPTSSTPNVVFSAAIEASANKSRSLRVFVHNVSLNCGDLDGTYDTTTARSRWKETLSDVSECFAQLQNCAATRATDASLECFGQFCDGQSQSTQSPPSECSTGIVAMCKQIRQLNVAEEGSQVLVHLWSLNLYKVRPYPNTLTTVLLMFLIVVVVVLLFPSRFYKILHQKNKSTNDENLATPLRRPLRSASESRTDSHHNHHFRPLAGSKSNHVADASEQP
ncbi:Protein Y52B11A.8 [Aphelenchoides avenae]|nr:Protein Y52B11A.8 [Aphelenchus avenae]